MTGLVVLGHTYEHVYWTDVMSSFLQDLGEDPTKDPAVLLMAHIKEIVQIIQQSWS